MAIVFQKAVQGLASGIGLVSESIKAHRASANKSPATASPLANAAADDDTDLREWELDEAQEQVKSINTTDAASPDASQKASQFNPTQPPPSHISKEPRPFPIVLPQRRPKERARGFVRAYPPILESRGISQAEFLDFLETFDKESEASPLLQCINLGSIGLAFAPHGLAVLASVLLAEVTKTALEIHGRSRTSTFLDKINADYFRPRGLYCMLLTYRPEDAEVTTSVNLTQIIQTETSVNDGATKARIKHRFKQSSGVTYGDLFAERAPLVYPGLDELPEQEKTKMKRRVAFVADYMDRRAQAKFATKNPSSLLAAGPKSEFTSRYSDPNNPASSGSLIAFVSGGKFDMPFPFIGKTSPDPRPLKQEDSTAAIADDPARRGWSQPDAGVAAAETPVRRCPRCGQDLRYHKERYDLIGRRTCAEDPNARGRNGNPQRKTTFHKGILYLAIVDAPAEEQMAEGHELAESQARESRK